MIWLMIAKVITLVEALLEYFVSAQVAFNRADDGQWTTSVWTTSPTPKGWAVLADVATIIHNGLDFVAQFTTLLPMNVGTYGSQVPLTSDTGNPPYW